MNITEAEFAVGDLVHHRLFDYRGVVVDVDYQFQSTDEWYETVAKSRPPKNKPWYHVLVHESDQTTYVAEQNLGPEQSRDPIKHPILGHFFSDFIDGRYVSERQYN